MGDLLRDFQVLPRLLRRLSRFDARAHVLEKPDVPATFALAHGNRREMRFVPKRRAIAPKVERQPFARLARDHLLAHSLRQFGGGLRPAQNVERLPDDLLRLEPGDARERRIDVSHALLPIARFGQRNADAGRFDGGHQARVLRRDRAQFALARLARQRIA